MGDIFDLNAINSMAELVKNDLFIPDFILATQNQYDGLIKEIDDADYIPPFENEWGVMGILGGIQVIKYTSFQDIKDIIERFKETHYDRTPKIIIMKESP